MALGLDWLPKDIRDQLLTHIRVKEEAEEHYNLLLNTTGKRKSFVVANFRPLKDFNLSKEKPVLYVKFKLKSKKEMLALSSGRPVQKAEKTRFSKRLAQPSDTSTANVERATKELNKREAAEKRAREKNPKKKRTERQPHESRALKS